MLIPLADAAGPEAAAEQLQEGDGATGPAEAAPAEPAEAEEELSDEERVKCRGLIYAGEKRTVKVRRIQDVEVCLAPQGKRIAQQWTHDPEAAGSVQVLTLLKGCKIFIAYCNF